MMVPKKIKNYQALLLIGLIIVLVLIVNAVLFFMEGPNIAVNYIAEWNRLTKPENYDPDKNAYSVYEKISSFVQEIPDEMQGYGSFKWPEWPGDFDEGQLNFLKDWLVKNNRYLKYLKDGSLKPYYWFEAPENTSEWERNSQVVEIRTVIPALCWRAKLNAFEDKIDEALDDVLTGYRIGCQLNSPRGKAFEQYFGRGIQFVAFETFLTILNNKQIDAKALTDFNKQITSAIDASAQVLNTDEEKLISHDIIQRIFTDDGNGSGHLIAKEAKKIAKKIQLSGSGGTIFPSTGTSNAFVQKIKDALSYIRYDYADDYPNFYWMAIKGTDRKKTTEDVEKIYSYLNKTKQKNPYQFLNENIDMEKDVEKMTNDYWARVLALSWYWPDNFERFYQHRCEVNSFLTILALTRYRADKEQFPDKLEELIDSGYIKSLPQDPYSEGPLTYKRSGDNFTLYSLGTNFTDNSGKNVRDSYNGRIIWWDRQKRADAVFWPYPNEGRQRRLQRTGKIAVPEPNEMIKEPGDSNSQSEK